MGEDRNYRRRNCADRARKAAMEKRRQRGKDPAMSIFVQLLAVAGFALRLMPDFSSAPAPVLPSPTRRVPIPVPGSEPWERYKGAPSWQRLVKDLVRPAATEDAQRELRSRLPPECSRWLDHVIREQAWGDVRVHAQPKASDDDVTAGLIGEARRWEAARRLAAAQAAAELKAEAEGGAASAAKPGAGTGWERKL